jgi:hypothetical protein
MTQDGQPASPRCRPHPSTGPGRWVASARVRVGYLAALAILAYAVQLIIYDAQAVSASQHLLLAQHPSAGRTNCRA